MNSETPVNGGTNGFTSTNLYHLLKLKGKKWINFFDIKFAIAN